MAKKNETKKDEKITEEKVKTEKKAEKKTEKKSEKKPEKKVEKKSEKATEKNPEKKGEKKSAKKTKLPQNILQIGDHVEQDKKIYITQSTYKKIQRFTRNKTKIEAGGILVGSVIEELGQQNIMIEGFIEGKDSEGTATTLTFTHKTWDFVHKEREKKFPKAQILGWIHTHPDFGIFLSDYDKFIHENFFNGENQVAYVVDPIQADEGFYFWINGNLERCKGFFIYDKPGVDLEIRQNEKKEEKKEVGTSVPQMILTGILCASVILLALSNLSMGNRLRSMEKKVELTQTAVTQQATSITELQTTVAGVNTQIDTALVDVQNKLDFIWEHEDYPELNVEEETETTEEES